MTLNNISKTPDNNLNASKKVWISILIFLVIVAIFFFLPIRLLLLSIAKDAEELFEQKANSLIREKEVENLQSNKAFYENHQVDLSGVESQLVYADMPIDLITFLEDGALLSGVKISISPGVVGAQEKDTWPTFDLLLSVEGSSSGLLKFLNKLESGQYFIDITSLGVTILARGEAEGQSIRNISAAISIKALVRK